MITSELVYGLLLPFLGTTLGSAMVFFLRGEMPAWVQKLLLGFASGVMIAASVWSLLIPSIDMTAESGGVAWLPAVVGFLAGMFSLLLFDSLVPHLHIDSDEPEGMKSGLGRSTMLFLAVTMHNIPEGMAVGLAFAAVGVSINAGTILSANGEGIAEIFYNYIDSYKIYAPAIGLALGIGIQNFPEGAAISFPLRNEGFSKGKAFLYGSLTGVVEPIFGILVTCAAGLFSPIMPWLLSFAAGAMIYVVADELIPQAKDENGKGRGTFGVMMGFLIMMILDVALG